MNSSSVFIGISPANVEWIAYRKDGESTEAFEARCVAMKGNLERLKARKASKATQSEAQSALVEAEEAPKVEEAPVLTLVEAERRYKSARSDMYKTAARIRKSGKSVHDSPVYAKAYDRVQYYRKAVKKLSK